MALTNFKNNSNQESHFDEVQRLMCSVDGCPHRWSVHLDGHKPKCSHHQWETSSDYKTTVVAKPITQSVQQWYERENF